MKTLQYPLIAPIGSAMGINLIKAEAKDIIFNADAHSDAVLAFVNRFPKIDIVYTIMDTSIEARALGCSFEMKGRVPVIHKHEFTSFDELISLNIDSPETNKVMRTNIDAVKNISNKIQQPLATYVVGPITLAAHLFGITNLIKLTRQKKEEFEKILNFTSSIIKQYAQSLVKAGADYIIILEPQALIFSPKLYSDILKEHIENIATISQNVILHVCGNTSKHLTAFAETENIKSLSLDWQVDFNDVKNNNLNENKLLLGNIDPVKIIEKGSSELIQNTVIDLLKSMKGEDFILSTGCDMVPETPCENLDVFIETAITWRKKNNIR